MASTYYLVTQKNHNWASARQNLYKTCPSSEDSDQPAHPHSLIWVFTDRMCLLQPPGYPKRKREPLPSWVDVQDGMSLCWLHRSSCRFCHSLAHLFAWAYYLVISDTISRGSTLLTRLHLRPVKIQMNRRFLPEDALDPSLLKQCPAKTLIRLPWCACWSEFSPGTHKISRKGCIPARIHCKNPVDFAVKWLATASLPAQ